MVSIVACMRWFFFNLWVLFDAFYYTKIRILVKIYPPLCFWKEWISIIAQNSNAAKLRLWRTLGVFSLYNCEKRKEWVKFQTVSPIWIAFCLLCQLDAKKKNRAIGWRSTLNIKMKWSSETDSCTFFLCGFVFCVRLRGCVVWVMCGIETIAHEWCDWRMEWKTTPITLFSIYFVVHRCVAFTQFQPAVKLVTTNNSVGVCIRLGYFFF